MEYAYLQSEEVGGSPRECSVGKVRSYTSSCPMIRLRGERQYLDIWMRAHALRLLMDKSNCVLCFCSAGRLHGFRQLILGLSCEP